MIEIFVVIALCKKLAEMAQERGHGRGWAALGALFWIAGEVIGGVIGYMVGGGETFAMYGLALLGAGLGALASWLIVSNLTPRPGSMLGDATGVTGETYSHADRNNPYSPSGFGQSGSASDNPYSSSFRE